MVSYMGWTEHLPHPLHPLVLSLTYFLTTGTSMEGLNIDLGAILILADFLTPGTVIEGLEPG